MAKKIDNKSFIAEDIGQPFIERLKQIISLAGDLEEKLKDVGKQSAKALEGIDPSKNIKDSQLLTQELEKLSKVEKEIDKTRKQRLKLEEQLGKVEEEKLKAQILQSQERKKRKKEIEVELVLQAKTIKSVESLTARNKALTIQAKSLNLETAEGVELFKAIEKEILDNKDEVKRLKDEVKAAKIAQEAFNKALQIEEEILKGNIKTRKELRDANKQLRIAVDNLDVDSQADDIERLNAIIDENTRVIEANSDEQTKAKINVGRYAESVQELLENQGILSREIQVYNTVLKIANFLTKKNTDETEENAKAKEDLAEATEEAKEAQEDLDNSLKKSIIGAIITAVVSLGSAWTQTSEGADTFRLVLANLNSIVQIFINRAGALANFLIKDFKKGIVEAKKDINDFKLSILEVANSPILKTLGLDFQSLNSEIEKTKNLSAQYAKEIADLDAKGQEDLVRATSGFAKQLQDILKQNRELLAQEKEKLTVGRTLEKNLAVERGLRERLSQLRDAESVSLTERIALSEKINEVDQRIGRDAVKLAKDQLNITNENIRRRLRENNISEQFSDAEINRINENAKLRKFVNSELLDEQKENIIALTEAENEFTDSQIENNRELNTLRLDLAELTFDNLEKFNDALLAQNEAIIASDTISLERKLEAQRKIQEVNQQTFDAQIQNIVAIQKANRETEIENLKLSGATAEEISKKRQEFLLQESDFRELLNAKDAVAFAEQIEALRLAERINASTADVLLKQFDIKQQQLDLDKAINEEQRDTELLAEEILIAEEEILRTKKVNAELEKLLEQDVTDFTEEELQKRNEKIEELEEERTKIEEDAENKRREAKIDSLKKELESVEEGSKRELEIKKELLDLEKEILDKKVENNIDANNEITTSTGDSSKDQIDILERSIAIFENLLDKRNQKALESIDKNIEANTQAQDKLTQLAAEGNEQAVKSLEAANRREAELAREKEEELQRQRQIEAGLAAFKVFAANAEQDPNTALSKTITEVLALSSFTNALPAFFEGTEHIGSSMNPHLNTPIDAFLANVQGLGIARLDGGERIVPSDINRMMIKEGIMNDDIPKLIADSKRGIVDLRLNEVNPSSSPIIIQQNDNGQIEKGLEKVANQVKRNSMNMVSSFNNSTSTLTNILQTGFSRTAQKRKIWIPKRKN